jgi:hypothetical protein
MSSHAREQLTSDIDGQAARRGSSVNRTVSRMVTLVLAVGFAVVGIAGAASAHHNTITGTVACKTGGGWAVTWKVVNSEQITETIKYSSRTSAVRVGTTLAGGQTGTFTETITTKPTSAVSLTLAAEWSNKATQTNTGTIAVSSFSDACNVTKVAEPNIPVVDDCGPGNAHFGTVPSGPWTSVLNPNGSVTVTTNQGYAFLNGQTTMTYPAPPDTNVACPTPPVVTPPVVTPPVVAPPEVLPAQVRVVRAETRKIDKCGRSGDLYKVIGRTGVVYKSNGKVLRTGVWLKATSKSVTVRAHAADASYELAGNRVWKMKFSRKACAQAPQVAPHTGS